MIKVSYDDVDGYIIISQGGNRINLIPEDGDESKLVEAMNERYRSCALADKEPTYIGLRYHRKVTGSK